jgi:MFS family permease
VSVNLAAGGFYAVLALFAREELRLGPTGYGLLVAASALGSVAAGLMGARVGSGAGRRKVALLTTPSVCLGFALVAGIPWLPLTVLVMIAFGWVVSLYNIVAVSLRQAITPDAMLGRVTAVHRFLAWGALPVGAVVAGFVGDWFGLPAAIGACAAAAGVGGLSTLPTLVRSAPATFVPEHAR